MEEFAIKISALRPWSDFERSIINWEFLNDETMAIYKENGIRICRIEPTETSESKTVILKS